MKSLLKPLWPSVLLSALCFLGLEPHARAVDLGNIWPLGDSITYGAFHAGGYRDTLVADLTARGCSFHLIGTVTSNSTESLLAAGQAHHDGHSGFTIADAANIGGKPRRGLYEGVETWHRSIKRPDVILLMIGINDLNTGNNVDTAPERLDRLVDRLFSYYPEVRILIATLPEADPKNHNRHGATNDLAAAVKNYNASIVTIVAKHKAKGQAIALVDMHAAFTLADLHDGLHPNPSGYAKMGHIWAAAVVAANQPH